MGNRPPVVIGEWACSWLLGLRDLLAAGAYGLAPRLPGSQHTEDGAEIMGWIVQGRGVFIRAKMVAVVGLPCSGKALYEDLYRAGVSWTQTKQRRGAQLFVNGRARRVVHLAPWAWDIVREKAMSDDAEMTFEQFESMARDQRPPVKNAKAAYLVAKNGGLISGAAVDWQKLRTYAPQLFGGSPQPAPAKTSSTDQALRKAFASKSYTQTAGGENPDQLISDALRTMARHKR